MSQIQRQSRIFGSHHKCPTTPITVPIVKLPQPHQLLALLYTTQQFTGQASFIVLLNSILGQILTLKNVQITVQPALLTLTYSAPYPLSNHIYPCKYSRSSRTSSTHPLVAKHPLQLPHTRSRQAHQGRTLVILLITI